MDKIRKYLKNDIKIVNFWINEFPNNQEKLPKLKDMVEVKDVKFLKKICSKNAKITLDSLIATRDKLVDRMHVRNSYSQYHKWQIIAIFLATIALIAGTWSANTTNEALKLSQINSEREDRLEGPHITVWQKNDKLQSDQYHLISRSGWENIPRISLCMYNDGKTSTGPINIYSGGAVGLKIQSGRFENLPSHEGNCTTLGIGYCWTNSGANCTVEQVPVGKITIPIQIDCTFCQKEQVVNTTICIFNQTDREC